MYTYFLIACNDVGERNYNVCHETTFLSWFTQTHILYTLTIQTDKTAVIFLKYDMYTKQCNYS